MKPGQPAIITLSTDFGLRDHYVAAMKGVLLQHCPIATLIDVTHELPRHNIPAGAIIIESVLRTFPPGTIHLVVVDPGVGTNRKILLADINHQWVICPDNGLITWAIRRGLPVQTHELTWRPETPVSSVFHGRDIMAPAAGMLAAGTDPADLATNPLTPMLLDIDLATGLGGEIIYIDHFGNATTNIPAENLPVGVKKVLANNHSLPFANTYADVPTGKPLALIGSSGLLEIAINGSSAAEQLHLQIGDRVTVSPE